MNSSPDPELELLRSGLESYLPAMNAIVAFRERILRACRSVLLSRLTEFSGALREPLESHQLRDYGGPPTSQREPDWASIGIELRDIGESQSWLYLSVDWEVNSECDFAVGASIWARTRQLADRIDTRFRDSDGYWQIGTEAGIQDWLRASEVENLEEHLTPVLDRWIKLWRKVGGLKALNGK